MKKMYVVEFTTMSSDSPTKESFTEEDLEGRDGNTPMEKIQDMYDMFNERQDEAQKRVIFSLRMFKEEVLYGTPGGEIRWEV